MPGLTGPALAERLERLRPGQPGLSVCWYDRDLLGGGAHDLAYEVVEKPFRPGGLPTRVRNVVDVARPHGESLVP